VYRLSDTSDPGRGHSTVNVESLPSVRELAEKALYDLWHLVWRLLYVWLAVVWARLLWSIVHDKRGPVAALLEVARTMVLLGVLLLAVAGARFAYERVRERRRAGSH
jgi:hypothetical protein